MSSQDTAELRIPLRPRPATSEPYRPAKASLADDVARVTGEDFPGPIEDGEPQPEPERPLAADASAEPEAAEPVAPPTKVDPRFVALARTPPNHPDYKALRWSLVESHLPLVHHLAQRFRGRGEPYDDLVQVGTIGLLHAVDRYDPTRGTFATYAVPTILGEIRRHFRDRGWALRIPRRIQDLGRKINDARETLTHTLDRSPTPQELATHLDVDTDLILEALETATTYTTIPLPTTTDETDHLTTPTPQPHHHHDPTLDLIDTRETLKPLLAQLPPREQRILQLRFTHGLTQSQIATEIGVSQMHISRLLTKSLTTLRNHLTEEL